MGDRISAGAYLTLFYFLSFIYLFFLYQECILYHIRAFCVCYQCNIELFCLFVLRFSVPVNNFMSYRAEPPHPGYKPILWKVNDHRTVLQNLTVRSWQGPPTHVSLYVGQSYLCLRKPPTHTETISLKHSISNLFAF